MRGAAFGGESGGKPLGGIEKRFPPVPLRLLSELVARLRPGAAPVAADSLNFRFQRKQSIAKSTYAICIGSGAAANVERGSLPKLSQITI